MRQSRGDYGIKKMICSPSHLDFAIPKESVHNLCGRKHSHGVTWKCITWPENGLVWGSLRKNLSHPQIFACSYTYGVDMASQTFLHMSHPSSVPTHFQKTHFPTHFQKTPSSVPTHFQKTFSILNEKNSIPSLTFVLAKLYSWNTILHIAYNCTKHLVLYLLQKCCKGQRTKFEQTNGWMVTVSISLKVCKLVNLFFRPVARC